MNYVLDIMVERRSLLMDGGEAPATLINYPINIVLIHIDNISKVIRRIISI